MKILGLTGGSGTGKSEASKAFAALGCAIVDADTSYHVLCDTCRPMVEEIQSVFSDNVISNSKVNRKKLGALVFAQPEKLAQLNAVTHPYIRQAAREAFAREKAAGCRLCIYDAPVLFEAKFDSICDRTCAVLAARGTRMARIMQRDNLSQVAAALRIDAQHEDDWYQSRCDYILYNDADLDALRVQVRRIYDDMLR